jgi:hypothetical protein
MNGSGMVIVLLGLIGLLLFVGLNTTFPVTGAPPTAAAREYFTKIGAVPDGAITCHAIFLHWQCDAVIQGTPVSLRCDNSCRVTHE